MTDKLVKAAVRGKFALTSREKASQQIRRFGDKYLELAQSLSLADGARQIKVPAMAGVDEDMREWSYFMLLEHNAIVNRSMTDIVVSLAEGRKPEGAGTIDPKSGVLPGSHPGAEQIDAFRQSIEDHLTAVSNLGKLKDSPTRRHPVFGEFDAHQWHCMLGFHLMIHLKQAMKIVNGVSATIRD